jgi:hypothetical protein
MVIIEVHTGTGIIAIGIMGTGIIGIITGDLTQGSHRSQCLRDEEHHSRVLAALVGCDPPSALPIRARTDL